MFKIAIIQFPRNSDDLTCNLQLMTSYFEKIAPDTDLVLLPEGWLGSQPLKMHTYQTILQDLFHLLKAPDCLLVSGAQYVEVNNQNLCRGLILSRELLNPVPFDKLFPSEAIGERNFIAPGDQLPVVKHKDWFIGVAVCVDLFYPEVIRSLALRGASLILNPATIPTNRIPLWKTLGEVRACENTVFVAMANNTDTTYPDGRKIMGDSYVAYPDGYNFFNYGADPGIYYAELELSLIDKARIRWPYLEDVRNRQPLY